MDIPVNAEVFCTDGFCGRSIYLILNSTVERLTHLVVREDNFPYPAHLVPVDFIVESTPGRIKLSCTKAELSQMKPFIKSEFIYSDRFLYNPDIYLLWPYVLPDGDRIPLEHESIPPGQLAIHRGAHVIAKDGHVGRVDDFLVEPKSGFITHLVIWEGHWFGQSDAIIPLSQIDHVEGDRVVLKLDRKAVEELPTIPLRRWRKTH